MTDVLRRLGQAATLLVIALVVGVFADTPSYTAFPPEQALIRLSFSHGGQRPDCRRRSPEELARLPANMRAPLDCPRGRLPVLVQLALDGELLYRASLPPSGIAGDGPSRVHQAFVVAPGTYEVVAQLRDSAREAGFDYQRTVDITLAPRRSFVIEFRADAGGFVFR